MAAEMIDGQRFEQPASNEGISSRQWGKNRWAKAGK